MRKGMRQPRNRFMGCLATKLQPEDYSSCLDDYNDEKYDNMKLVPSSPKKRVFESTQDQELRTALEPTITNEKITFSDLRTGLRRYMRVHPAEFKNYFDERRRTQSDQISYEKSQPR